MILNFICIVLDFIFELYFESISISISVFCDFIFQKFLSCLFDDFSLNLDPNSVFFDSLDSSLSLFSKNIKLPNFYPHFVVQFVQIRKDLKVGVLGINFDS